MQNRAEAVAYLRERGIKTSERETSIWIFVGKEDPITKGYKGALYLYPSEQGWWLIPPIAGSNQGNVHYTSLHEAVMAVIEIVPHYDEWFERVLKEAQEAANEYDED
jgi:hypothetical protein